MYEEITSTLNFAPVFFIRPFKLLSQGVGTLSLGVSLGLGLVTRAVDIAGRICG